jgi:hypothetical protein
LVDEEERATAKARSRSFGCAQDDRGFWLVDEEERATAKARSRSFGCAQDDRVFGWLMRKNEQQQRREAGPSAALRMTEFLLVDGQNKQ